MKTVWIYINIAAHVGDIDYLQVFATGDTNMRYVPHERLALIQACLQGRGEAPERE